jgi:hypothetical protein
MLLSIRSLSRIRSVRARKYSVLQPQDWSEIVSTFTEPKRDPLFGEIVEQRFDVVRNHILRLDQEAEAERA